VVSLGIFSVVPPTEPFVLRSTQPLKVSTRDFSWGQGGRCVWLTTYHHCSAETSSKSGALTYPELLGPPRPVAGNLYFLHQYDTTLSVQHSVLSNVAGRFGLSINHNLVDLFGTLLKADVPLHLMLMF